MEKANRVPHWTGNATAIAFFFFFSTKLVVAVHAKNCYFLFVPIGCCDVKSREKIQFMRFNWKFVLFIICVDRNPQFTNVVWSLTSPLLILNQWKSRLPLSNCLAIWWCVCASVVFTGHSISAQCDEWCPQQCGFMTQWVLVLMQIH